MDEAHVQNEQQGDAPDVAHAPAEPRNGADPILGGDLRQDAVVVDARQLEEDIAQPQQCNAEPEITGPGQNEEHRCADRHDNGGVNTEPEDGPPRPIGPLTGDRRQQGDDESGDRQPEGDRGLGGGLLAETGIGEVDGEDEGRDDRVEGGAPPVPQPPGEDGPGQQAGLPARVNAAVGLGLGSGS